MPSASVSLTIHPNAAAHIAELEMEKEMRQRIGPALQSVPELAAMEVEIAEPYDTGREPGVRIVAYSDRPFVPEDDTSWEIRRRLLALAALRMQTVTLTRYLHDLHMVQETVQDRPGARHIAN